nr:ribonuclease H-like domain-containing protein [Tanacetum cinerariifolium]
MTYTDKELDNVQDILHLKLMVGHPNRTEAFISKIRNLKLSNGLVLYDGMVIPKYCVSLISVHKLAKENKDFQENSDDEVDERSSKEYLRDLDVEYQEKALLANLKRFIKRRNNFSGQKANEYTKCYKCGNKVSKGFQPKFTPKLIQSSLNSNSQTNPKFQKVYKSEYKKMKNKLALFELSPSSPQNPKTFQPKNKDLVAKIFDWDEEEVSEDKEVTQVKVLMAFADDELTIGKSHARNGEWVDITIRKGATPSSEVMPLTFKPHSPKERSGLGIMKYTKPETHDSSNKSVSGTVTVSEIKQTIPSVPVEVKDTEQE